MSGLPRRAILVLGMHRSGTSAVTRLLGLAGATPPRELMPPTDDNTQGYWESRRIAQFNNRLLESAGTRWNDDAAIPEIWFTAADRQADRGEASAILAEEFADASFIVCKDPRLCRLLPFWREVFTAAGIEQHALLVTRDPVEVARSLAARANVPQFRPAAIPATSRSLLLWLRYVLDAERHSRDMPRLVVAYADVIADWRQTLAPLFTPDRLSAPTADIATEIDAFLDPGLRRQQSNDELPADVLPEAVVLLRSLQEGFGDDSAEARLLRDQITDSFDRLLVAHGRARSGHDSLADRDPWSELILEELAGRKPNRTAAPQRRSALFLSAAPRSIGHVYRVEHPAQALEAEGWRTAILPLDDPAAVVHLDAADIVVVFRGRWGEPFATIRDRCTTRSIPLVYDIDDLLFDPQVTAAGCIAFLDGLPPAEQHRWLSEAADYRHALEQSDAAVLTTPPLAAAAAAHCGKVFILPNALDRRMEAAAAAALATPKPSATDGRPRFVFASGTPTHHRDFAVAAEAVARIFARRPEPMLVIIGHLDPMIYPALAAFGDRIDRRPPVLLDDLFRELAGCEINLCPLELGNPFCEAKSGVRWLTAAAVGRPSIASPTEPLRDAVIDGVTGLIAADVDAWESALTRLLDNPQLVVGMGAAARRDALARFGFDAWAPRAVQIFNTIVNHAPCAVPGSSLP